MKSMRHVMLFDPMPFASNSKKMAHDALSSMQSQNTVVSVCTLNPAVWQDLPNTTVFRLKPGFAGMQLPGRSGLILSQFYQCVMVLWCVLCSGPVHTVIATTSPAVDHAIYFMRAILRFELIQVLSGPVSWSKQVGNCLSRASKVLYPLSAKHSIEEAIACRWDNQPGSLAHKWAERELASGRFWAYQSRGELPGELAHALDEQRKVA